MERIIGAEEEVSEAERGMVAAEGPPLAAREVVMVGGLIAQDARRRLAPGGIEEDLDPVAGREVELELLRLLEQLDPRRQELYYRS
jgi:hypothetical protein